MDEATQWEMVASTGKIAESYLVPVLGEMLNQFPFTIVGFHSDNGSEFVNNGVSFESLDAIAYQMSDNEFAERKVKARFDLFREINRSLERVSS